MIIFQKNPKFPIKIEYKDFTLQLNIENAIDTKEELEDAIWDARNLPVFNVGDYIIHKDDGSDLIYHPHQIVGVNTETKEYIVDHQPTCDSYWRLSFNDQYDYEKANVNNENTIGEESKKISDYITQTTWNFSPKHAEPKLYQEKLDLAQDVQEAKDYVIEIPQEEPQINLEKLICSWLEKRKFMSDNECAYIIDSLRDQGIEYKDNKLVHISESSDIEEKNIDVQPKSTCLTCFTFGDWIVYNGNTYVINDITENKYKLEDMNGNITYVFINEVDNRSRYWIIYDACAGDVVVNNFGIGIFKQMNKENDEESLVDLYCFITDTDVIVNDSITVDANTVYPATIDQRNTLLRILYNNGYQWDENKLKIK